MRGGTVAADTQHIVAKRQETLVVVTQVAGLGGAAWCAVLGIEVKHQLLTGEVGEFHGVAVFVLALEIRGF